MNRNKVTKAARIIIAVLSDAITSDDERKHQAESHQPENKCQWQPECQVHRAFL